MPDPSPAITVALIWQAQGGYGAVPWLLAATGSWNAVLLGKHGQTIAKRWLKIRIVSFPSGQPAGLGKAFGLRACEQGIQMRYARCVDLLDDLHAVDGIERRDHALGEAETDGEILEVLRRRHHHRPRRRLADDGGGHR